MLSRAIVLKTASWPPIERLVRKSFLFRKLVKRFVAGETLEEAIAACEVLAERGFFVSLDYLGENVKTESEAAAAKDMYIRMFERMAKSRCFKSPFAPADGYEVCREPFPFCGRELPVESANVSIKLTQCGLAFDDALAERHYRDVARVSSEYGSFLRIDMEDSPYTERTIRMVERVREDFERTGTVLQAYLHRTPEDVEQMIRLGARVRLVKGAYLEPPTVAIQKMREINEAYVRLGERLLDSGHYPAIATHNERLLDRLIGYAEQKGIPKDKFEVQMIYGVRRDLQVKLLERGYFVRVYVPFGESWYPYFARRIAERPANALFILRSLFKG